MNGPTVPSQPIGWIGSILYFGIPSAVFSASLLVLLPRMVRGGLGSLTIFNVTFAGPLALMLLAAMTAYRLEGRPWCWADFRDRMRLRRPTGKDWLWTIGLLVGSLGLAKLMSPIGRALSGIHLFIPPAEFSTYLASMRQAAFSDIDLNGRWDILAWTLFVLVAFNIGGEELWWRGIILPRQELAFGRWAWLVNGVLWDLFHIFYHSSLGTIVSYLPITVPLVFVAQRTRNTWPGIVAHLMTNIGILVAMVPRVVG